MYTHIHINAHTNIYLLQLKCLPLPNPDMEILINRPGYSFSLRELK